MPVVVAYLSVLFAVAAILPALAGAGSFTQELAKIAKLRATFGDEVVSAITNLPPQKYFEARDKALALAERAGTNSYARDDARNTLCAALEKQGATCSNAGGGSGVADEPSDAISAVAKPESADSLESELEAPLDVNAESASVPAPDELIPTEEPAAKAPAISKANEPTLESDEPTGSDRHVSSDEAARDAELDSDS